MRVVKNYGLPLDIREMLDLTIRAGSAGDHVFDPMAVRWIIRLNERAKTTLKLHEVEYLAKTFRHHWGGDQSSAGALWRFLATGKRL
ncbi:MAG: hypothetical protein JSS68_15170 [Actinobacteria bacterium]|nr:hypothetical protein [Actinomycetota bacterium]